MRQADRGRGRTGPSRTGRGRSDRGGGGIELAIILPLTLVCVFTVAHLSTYYLAGQAALSVAQVAVEGQRGWSAEPGAGLRRAGRFLDRLPAVLEDPEIVVTSDGARVTATVTGTAVSVLPWLTHPVTRTATGPVERVP